MTSKAHPSAPGKHDRVKRTDDVALDAGTAVGIGALADMFPGGLEGHTNHTRCIDVTALRTWAVVEEPTKDLMLSPLGNAEWRTTDPVDLFGPKF